MGQVGQEREAGFARFLDEDRDRRLGSLLGGNGLLAGLDEEDEEIEDLDRVLPPESTTDEAFEEELDEADEA